MNLLVFAGLPVAADDTLDPSRVGWSDIQVKATKFFLSMTTGISIANIDYASLREILLDPGAGDPIAPGGSNRELVVGIDGLGRHHETRLYLDAATGAAVQRISHDSGGRLRHRIYRFTDAGAYQWSWWPAGAEEKRLPPERWREWSDRPEGMRPYSVEPPGSIITEPAGLLYIIGAAPLSEPGDVYEVMAYMRGNVFPVRIRVIGREDIRVEFDERSAESTLERNGKMSAIKLLIQGEADENGENRFELLGMRGDIVMHIDPETRAPIQLQGKIKIIGQVTMRTRILTRRASGG